MGASFGQVCQRLRHCFVADFGLEMAPVSEVATLVPVIRGFGRVPGRGYGSGSWPSGLLLASVSEVATLFCSCWSALGGISVLSCDTPG